MHFYIKQIQLLQWSPTICVCLNPLSRALIGWLGPTDAPDVQAFNIWEKKKVSPYGERRAKN